ncbi:MAG: 30S ribosome-binding factor RbfA [Clostridia bacterium]|nr:30S ribosome-binding factor RbfA [Clostridia bacterium]
MAKYRRGRINDEMCKELANAIRLVKDPRVSDAFVSITGAEVSPDLKYAKIFYSALRGDPKETAKGLRSSAGFLRREIAQRMNLRITPELTFCYDESITYGAHISKLLGQAMPEAAKEDPEEDPSEEDGEEEETHES